MVVTKTLVIVQERVVVDDSILIFLLFSNRPIDTNAFSTVGEPFVLHQVGTEFTN